MKYHPDRNKDDKQAENKEAVLVRNFRIQKRSAYDQFGHDAFRQGGEVGNMDLEILILVVDPRYF